MLLVVTIMIKNEESSILETLRKLYVGGVHNFFVFDTGSTDNTVAIVKNFFKQKNINGCLAEEPFIDFATSRNRALELAEISFPTAKFFLMLDAEWYLHNVKHLLDFCKQEQSKNTANYLIKAKMGLMEFYVGRLLRVASKVRFTGVVHEVPNVVANIRVPDLVYFECRPSVTGVEKSRQRWTRDKALLLKEYQAKPTDPRTLFYLAQTCHCLGEHLEAYKFYQQRAAINGWVEENFITEFRLGELAQILSKITEAPEITAQTAIDHYLKAFSLRPTRIEPLVRIADHYWTHNNFPACYLFIRYAIDVSYPKDILFVEKEMYDYTRHEILSRCAWYMGEYKLGKKATLQALKIKPQMPHLLNNLKLYEDKLKAKV